MSTFCRKEVDLPLLATLFESDCFSFVVDHFELSNDWTSLMMNVTVAKIATAAKQCFGESTTAEICGSYAKKTNICGSDIDLYVDTVQPVTRKQREQLTALLKNAFDDQHVSLGIKSISVFTGFFDLDVVCSNTVEFGVLPRADLTITSNCPANLAIRALKFVVKCGRSEKVPGHVLEKFVQFVQLSYPIHDKVGDGGFQLFISLLQHVVDCGPSKIVGLPGGTGAAGNIHRIAVLLTHQFVVSRTLNSSFRSNSEVFGWLSLAVDTDAVETAVGIVPSWLLSLDGMPASSSPVHSVFQRFSSPGIKTTKRSDNTVPQSLTLLRNCQIAKYTLNGMIVIESRDINDEMKLLYSLALNGSEVARLMYQSRGLWYRGIYLMKKSDLFSAMRDFGESIRLTTFHSDPFSGFFTTELLPVYQESIRVVLASQPTNVDALLLRAQIFLFLNDFDQCGRVLREACKLAPDDCYGVIQSLGCCYANSGQWKLALPQFHRSVQLCPSEPIFYYWRAIARINNLTNAPSLSQIQEILDDHEHYFRLKPAPEGRKFANAWYGLAFYRMQFNMKTTSKTECENAFMKDMHSARIAEEKMLSVFPPVSTDTKKIAEALFDLVTSANPQLDITTRITNLKENGNAEFRRENFDRAIDWYSSALEIFPENVDILNNRSVAYAKLRYFSKALEDGEAARNIAKCNVKAYFRIMTAALGKKQPTIALSAAQSALSIRPGEESILKLQSQAEAMILELESNIFFSAFQCAPADYETSPCWPNVLYKHRVFVVDELGRTDFANIEDALYQASIQHDSNGITIILLPGKYSSRQLSIANASDKEYVLNIQIIGWTAVDKDTIIELEKPGEIVNENCFLFVIKGKCRVQISHCSLRQPFGMPIQAGHCVYCLQGSEVIIDHCQISTPDSPCFSVSGDKSVISVNNCTIAKVSAVVVCIRNGFFRANRLIVRNCNKVAIDIRENGNADLTDCEFSNCTAQAVSLYSRGNSLKMLRCKLKFCGSPQNHAAIMLETGQAVLTECEVRNCPGDAIILQERVSAEQSREPDPQLIMRKCIIEKNKSGLCFHHGYGVIAENKFNFNALIGIFIHRLSGDKKVMISGNTFQKNGVQKPVDFMVQCRSLFDRGVVLENNNVFDVAPIVGSDSRAAAVEIMTRQQVYGSGMR